MKADLINLAAQIVTANATGRGFSSEQIVEMIKNVAGTLENLSAAPVTETAVEVIAPEFTEKVSWESSIGKNSIKCLECGYECQVLTGHLRRKHQMTGKEYCQKYGIPARTTLASKNYSKKRSNMAKEAGLGQKMKEARAAKKAAAM